MNKFRGVVEIEILGEMRGFKFGVAATLQLCQILKCNLDDVVKRLSDQKDLEAQLNYYYTASCQYIRLVKKGDAEPSFEEVCNWVDTLLPEQREAVAEAAFNQYEDPNLAAPEKGQSGT